MEAIPFDGKLSNLLARGLTCYVDGYSRKEISWLRVGLLSCIIWQVSCKQVYITGTM